MITLAPRRDGRLVAAIVLAAVAAAVGLASGEPEPFAVAAATVALATIGLRHARTIDVDVSISIESRRLIEGDVARLTIDVTHPPTHDIAVHLADRSPDLDPVVIERTRPRPGTTSVTIAATAPVWGRHELGRLVVRLTAPLSWCVWEQAVGELGDLVVLPTAEHLDRLLAPTATQAVAGSHPARAFTGDGSEFVDIRAYQPGDRVRDINWKATARQGTPHVNRRRPERAGDVVIVLDAVPDGYWQRTGVGSEILQRAGQAAWGLARHHLAAQDRVGIVIHQVDGITWLPPAGGRRARYRLVETLLGANTRNLRTRRGAVRWDRSDIPSSALVLGISSLADDRALRGLASLRSSGRAAGVLALDAAGILDATEQLDPTTVRLASMVFDARVRYIRRVGTPIVAWRPGEDLGRAVKRLSDLTRRSVRVGAHG